MKTNALLAFFFFFLVALFASSRAEFVLDSEGHPVTNGGIYYLVPQTFTDAAIVGASIPNPDSSCSLAVAELLDNKGNATMLESNMDGEYITTDSPLHISFNPLLPNLCTEHPDWLVTKDENFGEIAVMVGADSEFPHHVSGDFYFKTHDYDRHQYNLVFSSDQISGSVAVKTDSYENRRLIVVAAESVEPLVLQLDKKSDDRVASHISMVV